MARLTRLSFDHEGAQYQVELSLDDAALMDDVLACDVEAQVTDRDGRSHSETIRAEVDFRGEEVRVIHREKTIQVWSLSALSQLVRSNDGEEVIPGQRGLDSSQVGADPLAEQVSASLGAQLVVILGEMPAPDPIICLVKAGLSSMIGQAIVCNESLGAETEAVGRRVRAIGRCLREHVRGILGRSLWRTARCLLFV
jgi:hypothetical protein